MRPARPRKHRDPTSTMVSGMRFVLGCRTQNVGSICLCGLNFRVAIDAVPARGSTEIDVVLQGVLINACAECANWQRAILSLRAPGLSLMSLKLNHH